MNMWASSKPESARRRSQRVILSIPVTVSGETLQGAVKESFLSAGLLSVLDALLDCSMEQALAELPLNQDIKDALISRSGPIGQALRCTIAYERGDWDDVQFYGMPPAPIREKYMQAISWARQLTSGLLN